MISQDFLFYNEKQTAPKSMMVERTRALRYVDHCQLLALALSALQIPRRSRFVTATAPWRLHDQTDVFGLHQWTRWHEEMALEFVFTRVGSVTLS